MKKFFIMMLVLTGLSSTVILGASENQNERVYDNNNHFKFTFQGGDNQRSNPEYRSSVSTNVPWGVGYDWTEEGSGTAAEFFMEEKNGQNVARTNKVQVGHKKVDDPWIESGSKNVYLVGQDNDTNTTPFRGGGGWDEECSWNW